MSAFRNCGGTQDLSRLPLDVLRLTVSKGKFEIGVSQENCHSGRVCPAAYWQIGSDLIVPRIHLRVFKHIKRGAEQHNPSEAAR